MTKKYFEDMCKLFGDPDLPDSDKWRGIKYIHIEGQACPFNDIQKMIRNNEFWYIDKDGWEPGFLFIDSNMSEPTTINFTRTITFMPIEGINAITFVSDYVDSTKNNDGSGINE